MSVRVLGEKRNETRQGSDKVRKDMLEVAIRALPQPLARSRGSTGVVAPPTTPRLLWSPIGTRMDAAKDLLHRAVELDAAKRYPEALICYQEGIQNLLRSMHGRSGEFTEISWHVHASTHPSFGVYWAARSEEGAKELRAKAEEYLQRAEEVKKLVKEGEG